jgi:alpha-L-fucosidase
LFSNFARGEWVMNREQIPPEEMCRLAQEFDPSAFDADFICQLAVDGGMKYIILTTMHHEGFRLYDTALTDFNAAKICGRDLVAELVDAARRHGLKIGLYHSLNNWSDQPDSVAALEDKEAYEKFISNTFARLEELVKKFVPFDILWYDGWWPFNSEGWQAVRMNETMR